MFSSLFSRRNMEVTDIRLATGKQEIPLDL